MLQEQLLIQLHQAGNQLNLTQTPPSGSPLYICQAVQRFRNGARHCQPYRLEYLKVLWSRVLLKINHGTRFLKCFPFMDSWTGPK